VRTTCPIYPPGVLRYSELAHAQTGRRPERTLAALTGEPHPLANPATATHDHLPTSNPGSP